MKESWASLYSGVQTNVHIGLDDGNQWGLQPAPSAGGKDGAVAYIHHSTDDSHQLCDQQCRCFWRDCSQNAANHHQIVASELIILALCFACSLQMYQFPIGNGRQKQTYNCLDTFRSENAHDKPSALSCRCHTLHHTPSEGR